MPSLRAGMCVLSVWAGLFGVIHGADAATTATDWVCEVAYQPTRQVWPRAVRLTHDERRLLEVAIDGVPVYQFAVLDTLILTSLDNERVRIDVASRTWSSDFRGLAHGQGRCEAVEP